MSRWTLVIFLLLFPILSSGKQIKGTNELLIEPNPDNIRHNPFAIQPPYDGIYSHGVETRGDGRYLHVSGQLGFEPSGHLPEAFKDQAKVAIENVLRVLGAADMDAADIVQMRFYLTDRSQIDDLINIRIEKLNGLAPAVTTYVVGSLLDEQWKIEVEALAFRSMSSMATSSSDFK